jgi:hypothetical protein
MHGHADGIIIPCQWGIKEKVTGYLLSNDEAEDILIKADQIPINLVNSEAKVRLFGEIIERKGYKEMSVNRYRLLDNHKKISKKTKSH